MTDAVHADLRDSFGLTPGSGDEGWLFQGSIEDTLAPQLTDAETCLETLYELARTMAVERVCIVPGSRAVLLILDLGNGPPLAVRAGLDARGIAQLIASLIRAGKPLADHGGAFVASL
jgi:hypothetical protein